MKHIKKFNKIDESHATNEGRIKNFIKSIYFSSKGKSQWDNKIQWSVKEQSDFEDYWNKMKNGIESELRILNYYFNNKPDDTFNLD